MSDCEETRDAERDEDSLPYGEHQRRLYLLRGIPCPLCEGKRTDVPQLDWTGFSLICAVGHGWSNVQALYGDLIQRAYRGKRLPPAIRPRGCGKRPSSPDIQ